MDPLAARFLREYSAHPVDLEPSGRGSMPGIPRASRVATAATKLVASQSAEARYEQLCRERGLAFRPGDFARFSVAPARTPAPKLAERRLRSSELKLMAELKIPEADYRAQLQREDDAARAVEASATTVTRSLRRKLRSLGVSVEKHLALEALGRAPSPDAIRAALTSVTDGSGSHTTDPAIPKVDARGRTTG